MSKCRKKLMLPTIKIIKCLFFLFVIAFQFHLRQSQEKILRICRKKFCEYGIRFFARNKKGKFGLTKLKKSQLRLFFVYKLITRPFYGFKSNYIAGPHYLRFCLLENISQMAETANGKQLQFYRKWFWGFTNYNI